MIRDIDHTDAILHCHDGGDLEACSSPSVNVIVLQASCTEAYHTTEVVVLGNQSHMFLKLDLCLTCVPLLSIIAIFQSDIFK